MGLFCSKKNGIQALEQEAAKAAKGDKFIKFGLDMVISGYTGEEIRQILDNTIETTYHRNCVLVVILKYMSNAAPGFWDDRYLSWFDHNACKYGWRSC